MVKLFTWILLLNLAACSPVNAQDNDFILKTPDGLLNVNSFSSYFYISFELNKPASFSLISNLPVGKAEISPKHSEIQFSLKRDIIDFRLSEPGYFMIRINDSIKIFLFAEKPEKVVSNQEINIAGKYGIDRTGLTNETQKIQQALDDISGSGEILYFPPGSYKSGQLRIRSNTRIHFPAGAVLNADTTSVNSFFPEDDVETKRFIYLNGAENVEIKGNGIINGYGNIMRSKSGDDARIRLILAVNSKNIRIEGLTLKDPGSWNTQVIGCNKVVLRNIKLLNNINLSNTDGFDPDASQNVLIENCFAYCGDDNVAVKTTGKSVFSYDVNDVTVRGCVFLTKKSSLKVGTETRCNIMKNITFENNDVLECDRGMALYVSDGASLENIIFRNNRFERNYPDAQKKAIHFDVSKRNPDNKLGYIRNVLIKDCYFENSFPRKSVIKYEGDSVGINVIIDNLVIAGKRAGSLADAGIESNNSNVIFK